MSQLCILSYLSMCLYVFVITFPYRKMFVHYLKPSAFFHKANEGLKNPRLQAHKARDFCVRTSAERPLDVTPLTGFLLLGLWGKNAGSKEERENSIFF